MMVVSNLMRFKNGFFDQICPMKNMSLGPGQYLLCILKGFLFTSLRVVFCLRLVNTVKVISELLRSCIIYINLSLHEVQKSFKV